MKLFALLAFTYFSANAFAIEFITEEQVQATIGADKVIEISTTTAEKLVAESNQVCSDALLSRSSRAYVAKKGFKSFLYVTTSGLISLQDCGNI